MTIKPVKSDNNESDVAPQHRAISSPKSPTTQHGIDQRSGLRNSGYGADDVVVNRHRRGNQKSGSSHSGPSNSNTQKHHKQRMVNHSNSGTNNSCTNDPSNNVVLNVAVNENDLHSAGSCSKSINANANAVAVGNQLSSLQSTSSNVIINSCMIGNNSNNSNLNNNNNNNSNGSNSNSATVVNLSLKNSPDRVNEIDDDQNSYSGYNSGDEHNGQKYDLSPEQWEERDKLFMKTMSERGFVIEEIMEDGACLFRSISLQIYGDQDMHEIIRQQAMDYIYQNREYFTQFVTEDIDSYVSRKRNNHVHGNHIEIQAISEIFNRPVEIYAYHTEPVNIFGSEQMKNGMEPLRLSYQRGSHYNAILNPYKPAVGLGLGLAGYRITDESPNVKHMRDAVRLSEDLEIEQTMFEDKLKTTDWEATNEAIEEQIARESYLQWCREKHQASKQKQNVHNMLASNSESMRGNSNYNTIQSSSTITSTSVSASVAGTHYAKMHSKSSRDSDDSGSCESADFYTGNMSPASSKGSDTLQQTQHDFPRSRKRRSNRRKMSQQNQCVNEVPTSGSYVMNSNAPDTSSPSKKRKLSSPDVPGPSSHHSQQQQTVKEAPMSAFYHSLLESSYADDSHAAMQLSEQEMIEKALQMSRLEFMQAK